MSATVGAALKKILTAILTEPKVLKSILFAVLVVVVAMLLPTVLWCRYSAVTSQAIPRVCSSMWKRTYRRRMFSYCGVWKTI